MSRLLILSFVVFLCAAVAHAQDGDIRAIAVQYSHLSGAGEGLNGWQSEVSWNREPGDTDRFAKLGTFGFDASVSQHFGHSTRSSLDSASLTVQRTTVLGGFRLFPYLPWIPAYVRAVAGVSHRMDNATDEAGIRGHHTTSPVVGAGAGIVLPIGGHVVIRPIQFDYLRFVGDGAHPYGIRLATGVSYVW